MINVLSLHHNNKAIEIMTIICSSQCGNFEVSVLKNYPLTDDYEGWITTDTMSEVGETVVCENSIGARIGFKRVS